MVQRPTVNQFPSFRETCQFLEERKRQCIWYLPAKGRLCRVRLTEEDELKALQWANNICSQGATDKMLKEALKDLTNVAEGCCCARHHRNPMYGDDMAKELAKRWLVELAPALATASPKLEVGSAAPDASSLESAFARHQVHESETIYSRLRSGIEIQRRTTGTIYFYTYQDDVAFAGMVKIGYTTATVHSRLLEWEECGYGFPRLLGCIDEVQHPQHVELLTHFELLECWFAFRWCKKHLKQHIEWFKVDFAKALAIAKRWSQWIDSANPYSRRGLLQARWQEHVDFLRDHEVPITSEAMMQIHGIEVGTVKVDDFVDDDALRGKMAAKVKAEVDETELLSILRPV